MIFNRIILQNKMELNFNYHEQPLRYNNPEFSTFKLESINYCLTGNKTADIFHQKGIYDYLVKTYIECSDPPKRLYLYLLQMRVDSCVIEFVKKVFTEEEEAYRYLYDNGQSRYTDYDSYTLNSIDVIDLVDGKYRTRPIAIMRNDTDALLLFETRKRTLKFLNNINKGIHKFPFQSDEEFNIDYQIYQKLKDRESKYLSLDEQLIDIFGLDKLDQIRKILDLIANDVEFEINIKTE